MLRTLPALALILVACQHDAAPVPSNKMAPPAAPVVTTDVLGFIPLASDIVGGVDVKALRASPLWAEYQPHLVAAIGPQLADLKQKCGFDPIETIESVTFGVPNRSDPANGVVVIRGLDRDRTIACLATQIIPDTTVTNDNGVLTLANKSGALNLVTFVDRSTLVLEGTLHPTKDSLQAVVRSGAPLRTSPAFLEMYDKLEPNATIWMVINGNAAALDKLGSMGTKPRGLYGTIRVAAGIAARVHLRLETADQAAQLAATFSGQLQSARPMFDQLAATSEGDVLALTVDLSAAQLRSLTRMMGTMFNASGSSPTSGGLFQPPPSP
jgi:hypothetical protein